MNLNGTLISGINVKAAEHYGNFVIQTFQQKGLSENSPMENIGLKSDFVVQTGANASKLALPPNTDSNIYQEFEVVKEIPKTIQSRVAPWGGSAGGGLQYELPMPILQLIKEGYIVPK